jgi:ribonuclease HI
MKKKKKSKKRGRIGDWIANPQPAKFPESWKIHNCVHVHFDGACGPNNPGGVPTFGWKIYHFSNHGIDDNSLATEKVLLAEGHGACIGFPHHSRTNNVAEWSALLDALAWMAENRIGSDRIVAIGDSDLVLKQFCKAWRTKAEHLKPMLDESTKLLSMCCGRNYKAVWVPRNLNTECDGLAEKAYERAKNDRRVFFND